MYTKYLDIYIYLTAEAAVGGYAGPYLFTITYNTRYLRGLPTCTPTSIGLVENATCSYPISWAKSLMVVVSKPNTFSWRTIGTPCLKQHTM